MAKGGTRHNGSLVKALEGLTDGLYGMFSKRIELARHEMIRDAQRFGLLFGVLMLCGVLLLIGYGLLNFAAVLLVGVFWSASWVMPAAAGALAVLNMLIAVVVALIVGKRLSAANNEMLLETRNELQRDRSWIKMLTSRDERRESSLVPLTPATHGANPLVARKMSDPEV